MRFGLLLPHFGELADPEKILAGAQLAERCGFDSVFVRDHLLFEPHGEFEKPNRVFYEALTTLTVIGASTKRIQLGTGALIPFRHPLNLAHVVSTMTQFFCDRIILGMGSGNFDHEFKAMGLEGVPRPELVLDNFEILRSIWSQPATTWDQPPFKFSDATIEPRPRGAMPPLWFCGTTPRSARLAAEFCDGWLPGRVALDTLKARIKTLDQTAEKCGRQRVSVGAIPTASIAGTRQTALDRLNLPGLLSWANNSRFWVKPPSGSFQTAEDLEGMLIYGTPDDVSEQCTRLQNSGVDHLIFDFRLSFAEWEDQIQMISESVLPEFRQ